MREKKEGKDAEVLVCYCSMENRSALVRYMGAYIAIITTKVVQNVWRVSLDFVQFQSWRSGGPEQSYFQILLSPDI